MALSPMMIQYQEIKNRYKDVLLMFRLGDFYELFFDDAITAAHELELTLTGRNCGLEERAPMCGVPFHAANSYIERLVKNGHKVAICEQLEDPKSVKGIVKRDVTRLITPGTLDILGDKSEFNNIYIMSIAITKKSFGIAYGDITTGELIISELDDNFENLLNKINVISPKEIILSDEIEDDLLEKIKTSTKNIYLSKVPSTYYKNNICERIILDHFDVTSLLPLGINSDSSTMIALGAFLTYLNETQLSKPKEFNNIKIKNAENRMELDKNTISNLELLETNYDHKINGSLFGILNRTKTAMGARLLKSLLVEPLKEHEEINNRLDSVEILKNNIEKLHDLTDLLDEIYDFERLTARIASEKANAKDLIALKNTVGVIPKIKEILIGLNQNNKILIEIKNNLGDFNPLFELIDNAIIPEPSFLITEGNIIKDNYSDKLDELKYGIKDAKSWLINLEQTEKEKTGIKNLKVGFNKVFGHYIEVSRGNVDKVPENYIRKQTLVNNERYITPELKEKESLLLTAETKINKLEYELFKNIRKSIDIYIKDLQRASKNIALLDVLTAFAKVANENNYTKPQIDNSQIIDIKNGRHPTVESIIGEGLFIENDTFIDSKNKNLLLITGPNMSGKSTYMRQTAVIVIMAQIGSFVPCENAHIGVVDRVFTRIGASDNLAYGQSTFFIEMSELSQILRNMTENSLILLDEIGRGTSTYDGLSIAWAVVEYLSKEGNKAKTMFATHYHELTDLVNKYDSIKNLSVDVKENGNNIIFLHKIIERPAEKSYGIHVAKIAGIPKEIRKNAAIKLKELEANQKFDNNQLYLDFSNKNEVEADNLNIIEKYENIFDIINQFDLDNKTPMEGMLFIKNIKDNIKEIYND